MLLTSGQEADAKFFSAPDIIKVDRCLVNGLSTKPVCRSVVNAFVCLAADLGATLVAEGVEDVADLDAARDLGVSAAPGYLLAHPSTDRADLSRWPSTSLRPAVRSTPMASVADGG